MSYLEELLPEFRKGAKIRRRCWKPECFLFIKDSLIFDYEDCVYTSYATSILEDDWELYEEPIDWQYIIDHKCLCLFWDEGKERQVMNFLKDVKNCNYKYPLFYDQDGIIWDCCRPVRGDEVTFYEDKKDEEKKS